MKKKLFTLLLALVAIATTGRAQNKINGHEYVDLGLPSGTLWATCNVGATKPEEYGDYFAWGETEPKDVFKWSNYSCCDGSSDNVHDIGDNISGSEYDAAYKKWGNGWAMPSREQFEELYSNTSSEWIVINGVNGWNFTSSNGNSIFLPAAGEGDGYGIRLVGSYGNYWTASDYNSLQHIASYFYFSIEGARTSKGKSRCCGSPIRPVAKALTTPGEEEEDIPVPAEAIDLGLPSGTLWASHNLGATKPEEYGHYFAWGETDPKDYYGWTDYKFADVTEEPNGTVDRSLVHNIGDDISGTSYDVAHTRWGKGWRMPNEKQANELVALCSWEESQLNGIKGYRVTGPNGKSIFLPSSGEYGIGIYWEGFSYWTSTISSNMIDYATFIWESDKSNIQVASHARCVGKSIRPVTFKGNHNPDVLLGDANGDGKVTVADYTAIAHYIMGKAPANFNEKAADVNGDGKINVADYTAAAHLILYGTVEKPK